MSHPNLDVVIGGYEDGHIRVFDQDGEFTSLQHRRNRPTQLLNIVSGRLLHDILAHTEAVTSVTNNSLDSKSIVTSSSNCSMRVWDLETKISTQDLGGHRQRAGEGICQVASDSDRGALVSAGADGVVRLWAPNNTLGSRLSKRVGTNETK